MDKKTLLAFALIGVVFIGWMIYTGTQTARVEPDAIVRDEVEEVDTTAAEDGKSSEADKFADPRSRIEKPETDSAKAAVYGPYAPYADGYTDVITIETDLVVAEVLNKGATLRTWELKNFNMWNNPPKMPVYPTQLIWDRYGELFLKIWLGGREPIDTRDLYYEFEKPEKFWNEKKQRYVITGDDSLVIYAKLNSDKDRIIKRFVFHGNKYALGTDIKVENVDELEGYQYIWAHGLRYQEENSVGESDAAKAFVGSGGSISNYDAQDLSKFEDPDAKIDSTISGKIDFTAIKIMYFGAAMMIEPEGSYDGTVTVVGRRNNKVGNRGKVERYKMAWDFDYNPAMGDSFERSFLVFIGPEDYDILKPYGLQGTLDFGWPVINQIGEYFILPIFKFIHTFIPTWGLTIIVFSIFMKLLLYPLSIQQLKSSQKMQLLGPEMQKLRDKYKDDQQKQQKETMKLYQEYGINPMGGCLPLLLQMPILFALWRVLRSAIELRQADFILWIHDLSVPDKIIDWGFPVLGMSHISGLALLMGVTMFLQQKMTVTDPRQKMMVYMMPIMFTFLFSNLPAGLNLYYFVFNLLAIGQQLYINKFAPNRPTLEDLRKQPKKEGWFAKKMREAQEMAEAQGKGGASSYSSPKAATRKKKKPKKK